MAKLVTVIGGSGFVGRYAVRALARAGWRVRVAVRQPHLAGDLRVHGDVGQVEPVLCNVHSDAQIRDALMGADAVVYLPGVLHERGNQNFKELSHHAPERVAKVANELGVGQFVLMSALGADENSRSAYSQAKAEGEAAVKAAFKNAVVLRPSLIFGPEDGFFNRFAKMAKITPALPLIDGGKTKFQPVYVGDVATAIVHALVCPDAAGQVYELGGPKTYSFKTLLQLILKETHRTRFLAYTPSFVAAPLGFTLALMARLVPFTPPLTHDQVYALSSDNLVTGKTKTLDDLKITPKSVEAIVPSYLVRFRPQGQYSPART